MSFDMITFLEELENYEFGVKHIIPAKYHPADIPGAFTDELDNILYARTYLEKQLSLYPQEVDQSGYFSRLEAADKLLHSKWEVILKIVPGFANGRSRLRQKYPETYWWWYLDSPRAVEVEQAIIYVSKERLGLTLAESIVARVGLYAGQLVKITVPDTKHILISVGQ